MKKLLFAFAVAAAVGTQIAEANLPDDQSVKYSIRVDPSDEQSDVLFTISLELTAIENQDELVKWEVTEASFVEIGSNGLPAGSWTKTSPTVYSSDGYWWVEHLDFDNPLEEEFAAPPSLDGTAAPDGTDDDLEFFLEAGTLTRTEAEMYDGKVAGLTHDFTRANEVDPIVDGEDEPSEVDPFDPPPV